MADFVARQERRRLLVKPEATLGTHDLSSSVIVPALAESRLVIESERVTLDGMLDGYAGGIMEAPVRKHWTGEFQTMIPDHGANWCGLLGVLLLASGFECTYDAGNDETTFIPSLKPIANWPGVGTEGSRSPCALSIGDVRFDDHAADSVGRITSATLASKLKLMRGEPMALVSTVLGLCDTSGERDYGTTDLSSLGALPANETTFGIPFNPTVTASRVTDSGSTSITLPDFDGVEIDFASEHALLSGSTFGYAAAPVFHTKAMAAELKVALSRANDINLAERTRLSLTFAQAFGSGATMTTTIPCAELGQGVPSNDAGKLVMTYPLRIVRSAFGVSTAPISIVLGHT